MADGKLTAPPTEAKIDFEWKEDLRRGMIKAVDIWQSLLKTRDLTKSDANKERKLLLSNKQKEKYNERKSP